MNRSFTITIPKPCSEKWAEMTPQKGGKFCVSCDKIVVDFSKMTDSELLDYFQNYQGGTCGNFNTLQIDRLIQPLQRPNRFLRFHKIAATVIGLFLSISGKTQSADSLKMKALTEMNPLSPKILKMNTEKEVTKCKQQVDILLNQLTGKLGGVCIMPLEIDNANKIKNSFFQRVEDILRQL
jgi:hypothetical protein